MPAVNRGDSNGCVGGVYGDFDLVTLQFAKLSYISYNS